jgi:Cysteine rich repeat
MRFRLFALMLAAVAALPSDACADGLQKIPYVVRPGSVPDAPDGAVRAACAKDFIAYCATDRIADCIAGHRGEFQPACRTAIDRAALAVNPGNRQATRQWACVQDARSFCASVQPGQGRIIQCLEDHLNELQPLCQTTLQAARTRQRSL